jgi:hypothetical protein
MLKQIVKAIWKALQVFLGISDPEHVWKWIGQEGNPRWSLSFWYDGFNYQAILQPSMRRPNAVGMFMDYACSGSIDVGEGIHYLPALMPSHRLQELIDSGLSKQAADRALKREIRTEMALTDAYDAGLWCSYKLTVLVKRGRTVLASKSTDGLRMDPQRLMLGGELHVTDVALNHRVLLRDAAIKRLKSMSSSAMHFR